MFCNKCGNELQDGVRFCTKCGAKFEMKSSNKTQMLKVIESNKKLFGMGLSGCVLLFIILIIVKSVSHNTEGYEETDRDVTVHNVLVEHSDVGDGAVAENTVDKFTIDEGDTDIGLVSIKPYLGQVRGGAINVSGKKINDISALSEWDDYTKEGMTSIILNDNNIEDISVLKNGFTNLEYLWLENNNISDISALSSLTNLKELRLRNNNITDISALSGLANLEVVDLDGNNIEDTSVLNDLPKLREWRVNGVIYKSNY